MKYIIFLFLSFYFSFHNTNTNENNKELLAENFFKGIYRNDNAIGWDLVDVNITFSYPDFTKLNNKEIIHGHEEIKKFSSDFCSKWNATDITFYHSLESECEVKLIWNYKAKFIGKDKDNKSTFNTIQNWSGVTFFKFNSNGKIISVKGEKSADGSL